MELFKANLLGQVKSLGNSECAQHFIDTHHQLKKVRISKTGTVPDVRPIPFLYWLKHLKGKSLPKKA